MSAPDQLVLVADDDPETRKFLGRNLEMQGYRCVEAHDGAEALNRFYAEPVDLVLLDINMPPPDGYGVCERIRRTSDVPVIMVTGQATEHDKVRAFDMGADDFLTKPFGVGELIARVKAALRRGQRTPKPTIGPWRADDLEIDFSSRLVKRKGARLNLTPIEFSLVSLMVRNSGRVLTHRFILESVWGDDCVNEKEYLRAYIYRLRRKLEADPDRPSRIVTVPTVGYVFQNDGGAAQAELAHAAHRGGS